MAETPLNNTLPSCSCCTRFRAVSLISIAECSRCCLTMRRYLFLLSALAIHSTVHANCFHPNGTETTDPSKKRCSDDESSPLYDICCALNRDVPFGGELIGDNYTIDACLPNGICHNRIRDEASPNGRNTFFREECTYSDWTQGNCPNFCVDVC